MPAGGLGALSRRDRRDRPARDRLHPGLPPLFAALVALPDLAKIALSLALIAPLAFFMGMPFPLALARLRANAPDLVPWAWAINGCASVLSAILATLLAMTFGTRTVVFVAAALYLIAGLTFSRRLARTAALTRRDARPFPCWRWGKQVPFFRCRSQLLHRRVRSQRGPARIKGRLDQDGAPHCRLCSVFKVSNLRIKRTLEGRSSGAAFDIGCEPLVARDDVGVLEHSEHRRHYQIAGRETVAVEEGLSPSDLERANRRLCTNSTAPGRRSFADSSFA